MGTDLFDLGSGLAVPGLEAVIEYGDAAEIDRDRIPGAMLINDLRVLEHARLEGLDGLHSDPDAQDPREENPDRHGERAGAMFYRGRTIGLTGFVEAGSIKAVRDVWTRLSSQLGTGQRDLLLHVPFEVPQHINEVKNPEIYSNVDYWVGSSNVSVAKTVYDIYSSYKLGKFDVSSATAAGDGSVMKVEPLANKTDAYGAGLTTIANESVTVGAYVGCGTTMSSIELIVVVDGVEHVVDTVAPTVGSGYWLIGSLPRSSMARDAARVNVRVKAKASSGSHTLYVTRAMLVKVPPGRVAPASYIGPSVPGYEHDGDETASTSSGPGYIVNDIPDPTACDVNTLTGKAASYNSLLGTGVTTNADKIINIGVGDSQSSTSYYFKQTKDNNTTSRLLASRVSVRRFRRGMSGIDWPGFGGRTYKAKAKIELLQKPPHDVHFRIGFYGLASLISQSTVTLELGVQDVEIEATAPENTAFVRMDIVTCTSTTAQSVLEGAATDVSFVDVTDYDQTTSMLGLDELHFEASTYEYVSNSGESIEQSLKSGVRRRIPRPFLIKKVRKASEGARQAETQEGPRARRAFTVGMRAADPRIYVLDRRHEFLQLTGTSTLVAIQSPTTFAIESTGLPVPDGYTYEGHYITNPGGPAYKWSPVAYANNAAALSYFHPRSGIGIKTFGDTHGVSQITNQPAQDILARVYRSQEAFTYQNPKVILGCAPSGYGSYASAPPIDLRGMHVRYSGSAGSRTYETNEARVLLKRVSSGTWLELRWCSYSKYSAEQSSGVTESGAPYAFELWSSHNGCGIL